MAAGPVRASKPIDAGDEDANRHHDVAGRLGEIKERCNVGLDCRIGHKRFGFAAASDDGAGDVGDFLFGAAGNDGPEPFSGKPAGQRRAETALGANPYNNSRAVKRGHAGFPSSDSFLDGVFCSIWIGRLPPPMACGK
jgi:hypothetical protein